MSLLYVGPYKQNDEWGRLSKAFVKTLTRIVEKDKLVIRPVWFNTEENYTEDSELNQYELNRVEEKGILIQHGLPNYLNYNGSFKKNIAVTSVDCRIDKTSWVTHLNLFDEVVTFSKYETELLIKSGVKTPIFTFEIPPTIMDFKESRIPFDYNGFKFYTVASDDVKSGFIETLVSFLSTYSILDNVILVAFTDNQEKTELMVKEVREGLGIYRDQDYYAKVAIVNSTEQSILAYAHKNFDVFIDVSYNSRISQNILKCISYGKIPIILDTCNLGCGYKVKSSEDLVYYKQRPLAELYSGEFTWRVPSTPDLKYAMSMASAEYNKEKELDEVYTVRSKIFTEPLNKMKELISCSQ